MPRLIRIKTDFEKGGEGCSGPMVGEGYGYLSKTFSKVAVFSLTVSFMFHD